MRAYVSLGSQPPILRSSYLLYLDVTVDYLWVLDYTETFYNNDFRKHFFIKTYASLNSNHKIEYRLKFHSSTFIRQTLNYDLTFLFCLWM